MNFGLPDVVIEKYGAVFSQFPQIEKVILYGSRAKGSFRVGSDIDITLIGNDISSAILSQIEQAIDDLNTPYLTDISVFNELESPSLIEHIERVGKCFYEREVSISK